MDRFSFGIAVLAVAVFGWNLYRAAVLTLTHDEAITYLRFVAWGPQGIYDTDRYDANNHVLYSLLAWITTSLFGVNELALRLPAVLTGLFVVVATGRFFRLLAGPTVLAFAGVLVVVLNPLVMDFLVAARGYGLGLGFSLWAWGSLIHGLQTTARRPLISAGISQGLAVGANLVFVYPNAALAVVFLGLILVQSRGRLSRTAKTLAVCYIGPGAVTAAALSAPVFGHLGGEHFYYGTESLFATAESLVEPSLRPIAERGWFGLPGTFPAAWLGPMTGVAVAVFAASLLPAVGVAGCLRRPSARTDGSISVDALIYGGTVGVIGLVVFGRLAAGTPYPQDRTGIYFIPLAAACLVLGLKRRPRLAVGGGVLLTLLATHFVAQVQAQFFSQWRYDAGTGRVYRLLEERAGRRPGLRVGHDWRFEPTLNYYNWLAGSPFPLFGRPGPEGEYDLYYLERPTADEWLARGGYRVVYEDPVSKAVVVEREGR